MSSLTGILALTRDERDTLLDVYLHAIETAGPVLQAAE